MRYHLITYGCQMNKSDSERIASVLEKIGYEPAPDKNGADLIVVNSCSVRQSAIDRIWGQAKIISNLKSQNSNLRAVLTGCVLAKDKEKFKKRFDLLLDIKDLAELPKILNTKSLGSRNVITSPMVSLRGVPHYCGTTKQSRTFSRSHGIASLPSVARNDNNRHDGIASLPSVLLNDNIAKQNTNYFAIAPKCQSNSLAYVPIMTGCNNFCTYCAVPYTRGREISRPVGEISCEIKNLIKRGYKEIILLGQNVNSYKSKIQNPK